MPKRKAPSTSSSSTSSSSASEAPSRAPRQPQAKAKPNKAKMKAKAKAKTKADSARRDQQTEATEMTADSRRFFLWKPTKREVYIREKMRNKDAKGTAEEFREFLDIMDKKSRYSIHDSIAHLRRLDEGTASSDAEKSSDATRSCSSTSGSSDSEDDSSEAGSAEGSGSGSSTSSPNSSNCDGVHQMG